MVHALNEYKLTIPIENVGATHSEFGVVEIEPFERSFDRATPDMMRSIPVELEGGNAITWVDLPEGQYLTRLRFPDGRLITKLIHIVPSDSGPVVRDDVSRQSPPSDFSASNDAAESVADAASEFSPLPSATGEDISSGNAYSDALFRDDNPMVAGLFPDLASTDMVLNSIAVRGYTKYDVSLVMSDQARSARFAADVIGFEWAKAGDTDRSVEIGNSIHGVIADLASTDQSQRLPGTDIVAAGQLATELAGAGALAGKTIESPATGGIDVTLATGQIRSYEDDIKRGGVVLGVTPRLAEDAPLLVEIMSANSGTGISGPGSDGHMPTGTVGAVVGDTNSMAGVTVADSLGHVQAIKGILFGASTDVEHSPQYEASSSVFTVRSTTIEDARRFICDLDALQGNPHNRRQSAEAIGFGWAVDDNLGRVDLSKFLGLSQTGRNFDLRLARLGDTAVEVVDRGTDVVTGYERYTLGNISEISSSGVLMDSKRLILARLPGLWRCVATNTHADIQIRPIKTKSHGSLSVSVSDPRMDAILDFMQQTDLKSALSLVETCANLLFAKYDNPYAAAASAYVLLAAPPERTPPEFNQWVANLGHNFNDIPDGCIQYAAILLQTSTSSESLKNEADFPATQAARNLLAAELLIESLIRGLPIYRSGFKLLISSLRILQEAPEFPPEMCQKIEFALKIVNQIRLRLDVSQPFTVLDVTGLYVPAP